MVTRCIGRAGIESNIVAMFVSAAIVVSTNVVLAGVGFAVAMLTVVAISSIMVVVSVVNWWLVKTNGILDVFVVSSTND